GHALSRAGRRPGGPRRLGPRHPRRHLRRRLRPGLLRPGCRRPEQRLRLHHRDHRPAGRPDRDGTAPAARRDPDPRRLLAAEPRGVLRRRRLPAHARRQRHALAVQRPRPPRADLGHPLQQPARPVDPATPRHQARRPPGRGGRGRGPARGAARGGPRGAAGGAGRRPAVGAVRHRLDPALPRLHLLPRPLHPAHGRGDLQTRSPGLGPRRPRPAVAATARAGAGGPLAGLGSVPATAAGRPGGDVRVRRPRGVLRPL
ncbi:MAG: hypothetical protein AVDCRST_MAG41-3650, partial [uncultured Corynebacteriales bacterium]